MKTLAKGIIFLGLILSGCATSGRIPASIPPDNACPDLAGNYKTADGAPFVMTSKQQGDGSIVFGYDRDTWIADGNPRDSHTGAPNPVDCPSIITCKNKVLTRSYNCYGTESVETYSLDRSGNILVSGHGMGLNGKFTYYRTN